MCYSEHVIWTCNRASGRAGDRGGIEYNVLEENDMKKARGLAWLLVIAMLAMACPAFGEEPEVVLTEEAAVELPEGIEVDVEADADEFPVDDGMEDGLAIELPELDLDDGLSDLPDSGLEANDGNQTGHFQSQGGYDNEALFAGYVDMLFGKGDTLGLRANGWAGDRLTGAAATAYNYLLEQIEQIAAGTLTNTQITIPSSVLSASQAKTAYNAMYSIIEALLVDCPYHLFWYDKTQGVYYGIESGVLSVSFTVASEFASGTYKTDATRIKAAQTAATNAKNVVKKYAGASDYDKLCAYRDYICSEASYNDDAAADPSTPYGNPWQLIWAFDGNSGTNIVCEGYAKAFQYLCDLSSFRGSIQSHIVNGYAQDQGGGGPHMWNIVTMEDGRNYHVDVTFVDSGFSEAFLCGAATTQYENVYLVKNEVYYQYDEETLAVYPAKVLKLSTSDYVPGNPATPEETEEYGDDDDTPTGISITQGSSATLYMGNKLNLTANLTPAGSGAGLTWKSAKTAIATVNGKGVVTPKKAGTTKITVTTDNGLSASITVKVIDASSVKLKKGTKVLKKGQKFNLARGKSMTVKAVVAPSKVKTRLTWKSSYKYVTVKNGKITVSKKAKAGTKVKITVKTANGKSNYIYIVVK